MDQHEFEAQLKADGYQEIEMQTLAPRPGKGRHRHLFAIRGLVLSGTFLVAKIGDPAVYGPMRQPVFENGLHSKTSVVPMGLARI
jgi:hypothetical protein